MTDIITGEQLFAESLRALPIASNPSEGLVGNEAHVAAPTTEVVAGPPNAYAQRARLEGAARDVMRAIGMSNDGLNGRWVSNAELVANQAEHILKRSVGCYIGLQAAGVEMPDLPLPPMKTTSFRALVGRRVKAQAGSALQRVLPKPKIEV